MLPLNNKTNDIGLPVSCQRLCTADINRGYRKLQGVIKMSELKSLINEFEIRMDEGEVRDVVDWSDVEDAGRTVAKKVHGKIDNKKLKGIITNAKKHKPDSTAAAIELVKNMLQEATSFNFDTENEIDQERNRDHGEIDFDDYDGEDEPSFGDEEEMDMGDDGEAEEFAGEKRVDITNKLKAMLQNRGETGTEGEDPSMDDQIPDLSDLDLEDEDDLNMDGDDDLDFDYDAFDDESSEEEPKRRPDEDGEDGEFNFSSFSR